MTMTDPLAEMMSEGAPAISFADDAMKGTWVIGLIQKVEKIQQTDFVSKKPKFYDEEKTRPMYQYVFTLGTEERKDEDDDGTRRLYARGQMIGAIKNALGKAGVTDTPSALGGKLAVCWTGYGEGKEGLNPPKLYQARFQATDATSDLANEPVPEPPSPMDDDSAPF